MSDANRTLLWLIPLTSFTVYVIVRGGLHIGLFFGITPILVVVCIYGWWFKYWIQR